VLHGFFGGGRFVVVHLSPHSQDLYILEVYRRLKRPYKSSGPSFISAFPLFPVTEPQEGGR
jgi:hypothetical protein